MDFSASVATGGRWAIQSAWGDRSAASELSSTPSPLPSITEPKGPMETKSTWWAPRYPNEWPVNGQCSSSQGEKGHCQSVGVAFWHILREQCSAHCSTCEQLCYVMDASLLFPWSLVVFLHLPLSFYTYRHPSACKRVQRCPICLAAGRKLTPSSW